MLIDADEQAQRAADAGWETARWTFWLVVATFLLVAGAVAAAIYARRTWMAAQGQLEAAVVSEQEREARNVSAWLEIKRSTVSVFVRNGNGGPVYDVVCTLEAKTSTETNTPSANVESWSQMALGPASVDDGRGRELRMNFSEESLVFSYDDAHGRRFSEKGTTKYVVLDTHDDFKLWDGSPDTTGLAVRLTFRDSSGKNWHRAWTGELTLQPAA
ncbi:hypothetical protein [Paenarthrobacter sp. FR1]|uniref:hypothetical protein n=1 Tax=Paenarthrobacter sp. FR1 TaxID=3439548 RepID=UPI003DA67D21